MNYDIGKQVEKQSYISALSGKTVNLLFENGRVINHTFKDEKTLTWTILEGEGKGLIGTDTYEAIEVRPGILFVDFYKAEYEEEVTFVWNLESGNVFVAVSRFYDLNGEKRMKTDFVQAVVEGLPGNAPITQSSALVGKHVLYRYSSDDWYEHVYLNKETFTWHCVNGAEKGLADTEKCAYFDVADGLTILFWTETIMPVESIVVVDLKEMRSTGRFLCWDPKPKEIVHLTFGSLASFFNDTREQVRQNIK